MKEKKATKQTVPWQRIFQMATAKGEGGKPKFTIAQIARATQGEIDEKSPDKYKPTRARLAKFRATGVLLNGKLVRLPKSTVRRKLTKLEKPKMKGKPKKSTSNLPPKRAAVPVQSSTTEVTENTQAKS